MERRRYTVRFPADLMQELQMMSRRLGIPINTLLIISVRTMLSNPTEIT